nr:hypothetical protein [uncultured Duganella sp.]
MNIPFFTRKQNSPGNLISDKETCSGKAIAPPADVGRIAVIPMEECSNVSGGPQISNNPPN